MAIRFRPPLWSWLGLLTLGALLVSLGTWQLQRAQYKRALEVAYAHAAEAPQLRLDAQTAAASHERVTVAKAVGRYDSERQILLDNQPRRRVPGYRVWTPLALDAGGRVMVDRGWVPADPDRARLPQIEVSETPREVSGYWRPLPEPGLRLAVNDCAAGPFPRVLSFPTAEEVECVLGVDILAGVLQLDPEAPDGFVREWSLPNPVPPARHYAYAAQWYAFAATLLFLFVKLNLKRSP